MKKGVVVGAALIGGACLLVGATDSLMRKLPAILSDDAASSTRYADLLASCSVTDGDTIRCGEERIRLLGIDAPEMPGHCRPGRNCVEGDPYASTSSLAAAMSGQLTIERVGEDHYGRTLAVVAGSQGDLSCWQLKHKQAVYKAAWDNGLRVARACLGGIM